jgi:putative NIF3 family GTP cyclohydrolase 1 type 2
MRAQEIVDYVFSIAPNPAWGRENFFEFGGGDLDVTGVGVSWWLTSDMLADFPARGLNLGLTHERVIYDLPAHCNWGRIPQTWDDAANQRIADLATRHGLAIHRFHSNIDLCDWGMPVTLLRQLGWDGYPADWSRGVPVVTHPPLPLGELIAEVKARLALPFVRYDGDPRRVVSRIAVPWGGLCQWWAAPACAAPLGCDVLLGGDIIDGVVRYAREHGWAVVDAFHHSTEMGAMTVLAEKLRARFPGLPVHDYPMTMPWAVA